MFLVGYIDFTYGANITAVADAVRKVCISQQVTQTVSLAKQITDTVDFSVVLNTDC